MPKLDVKIEKTKLSVGLKGNPPFINGEEYGGEINKEESLWTLDDGEIEISLQKLFKGKMWDSALKGHQTLDPLMHEEVKKNMLLE